MGVKDFWKSFAAPLGLMVIFVIAFFGVQGLNKSMSKPPIVTLTSGDNVVTDQAEVPITGKIENTTKLTVNEQEVPVGEDGSFSTKVPVNLGENKISVAAGSVVVVTRDIKVVREEVAKAITATSTEVNTQTSTLSASGPVENVLGSIGFGAIFVSLMVYRKSKRHNPLQKPISLV